MNILNQCNDKEKVLLKEIGIEIENKEYSTDEVKEVEAKINDYIMSLSIKNGDLQSAVLNYGNLLNKLADRK